MVDQKLRKTLAGQAHRIKPFLVIADAAVRESHLEAIRSQFTTHELIKVRILGESKDTIDAAAREICEATGCDLIARTGHMAVLFLAKD